MKKSFQDLSKKQLFSKNIKFIIVTFEIERIQILWLSLWSRLQINLVQESDFINLWVYCQWQLQKNPKLQIKCDVSFCSCRFLVTIAGVCELLFKMVPCRAREKRSPRLSPVEWGSYEIREASQDRSQRNLQPHSCNRNTRDILPWIQVRFTGFH